VQIGANGDIYQMSEKNKSNMHQNYQKESSREESLSVTNKQILSLAHSHTGTQLYILVNKCSCAIKKPTSSLQFTAQNEN